MELDLRYSRLVADGDEVAFIIWHQHATPSVRAEIEDTVFGMSEDMYKEELNRAYAEGEKDALSGLPDEEWIAEERQELIELMRRVDQEIERLTREVPVFDRTIAAAVREVAKKAG